MKAPATCDVFDILDRGTAFKIVDFDSHTSFTRSNPRQQNAEMLLREKGWTLFSLDFERSQAVFLDIGRDCDVSKAPFTYLVQFETAKRQALISFDDFLRLADRIEDPQNLVHLFNMGHCGSTLLHHVFNRVPGVWCNSEPICFVNLAFERDRVEPVLLSKMTRAALRFMTLYPYADAAQVIVIKHFSQSTFQIKTVHDAVPHAKSMFMYRDGKSWTNSLYHFVQKVGGAMVIPQEMRKFTWRIMSADSPRTEIDGIVDLDAEVVTFDSMAAVGWALHIRHYLKAVDQGVPLFALRYNELTGDREKSIARVFEHLGIRPDAVAATLQAFDEDSQHGTRTARDKSDLNFTKENYARVAEVFAHPRINIDPDMILQNSRT